MKGGAPGAETVRELFGGQPTLVLLDELSVYLRKFRRKAQSLEAAGQQLAALLTTLFKAVEGTPNATVVYTLALGRTAGRQTQARGSGVLAGHGPASQESAPGADGAALLAG